VSFSSEKPKDKQRLITRKLHSTEDGDFIQEWPEWSTSLQEPEHTHWWDGDYDCWIASVYWKLLYSEESKEFQ